MRALPVCRQHKETEAGAHTHSNQVKGSKFMGLCRVEEGGVMRHLDLFTCPDDSWATHLLHCTGSDMHNRSMRHWAQQCGLALSEKALCPCTRAPGPVYVGGEYVNNKIRCGAAIPLRTERDVYDRLG